MRQPRRKLARGLRGWVNGKSYSNLHELGMKVCSFGVCCVFSFSTSGATLTQNSSYIQNPGFPSPYIGGTGVTYTVSKASSGERAIPK